MSTYRTGNMFQHPFDFLFVTGNSFIKNDGSVVMGKGAAKLLKEEVPNIDKVFGSLIKSKHSPYGLVVAGKYGLVQVKDHFRDSARISLIDYSIQCVYNFAMQHRNDVISMNYPGIGNGRLKVKEVFPYVELLPDNVQVWTFRSI